MKRCILFQTWVVLFFLCVVSVLPSHATGGSVHAKARVELPGVPSDTTVTVKIVRLDVSANSVTLKDGSGKLWNFVVDPQLIDLRKFRVGQTVTATISTTLFIDKVTRARITKIQLLKLQ